MNKLLATEAAWLAGLFEGEGSVGLYGDSQPRISIGQHTRSKEVLDRVQEILGVGKIYGPYKTSTGTVCHYQLNTMLDVHKFIKVVYPYLMTRRREQCHIVLAHIEQTNKYLKEVNVHSSEDY